MNQVIGSAVLDTAKKTPVILGSLTTGTGWVLLRELQAQFHVISGYEIGEGFWRYVDTKVMVVRKAGVLTSTIEMNPITEADQVDEIIGQLPGFNPELCRVGTTCHVQVPDQKPTDTLRELYHANPDLPIALTCFAVRVGNICEKQPDAVVAAKAIASMYTDYIAPDW
jgi:hypothetical protein